MTEKPPRLNKSQLLWVDGSLADLKALSVLPSVMKAALAEKPGSSSLEIFDAFYRFVLPCVSEHAGNKRASLTFIVGKSWLLTVSGSRPKFMDSFVETDRGEKVE